MHTFFRIRVTYRLGSQDHQRVLGLYDSLESASRIAFDCRETLLEVLKDQLSPLDRDAPVLAVAVEEFTLVPDGLDRFSPMVLRTWMEQLN